MADVAVPDVPRSAWMEHPRYPQQTLLIHSHEGFRRMSRWVLEQAERGADLVTAAALYGSWIRAMRSHERYEEKKLYPFLTERWGVSMASLCHDHEQLHSLDAEVREGFQHAIVPRDRDPEACRVRLESALRAFDEALGTHLDAEEERVIPLLLELEPEEFAEYTSLPLSTTLQRLRARRQA